MYIGRLEESPIHRPGESVAKRACAPELWEDDWNPTTNRMPGLDGSRSAEKQSLHAIGGAPGKHVCAVMGDEGRYPACSGQALVIHRRWVTTQGIRIEEEAEVYFSNSSSFVMATWGPR